MTRPVRLPQLPQSEKGRREEYRKREQAIEDARNEAYLKKAQSFKWDWSEEEMSEVIGCPECKMYSLELVDPYFIWHGKLFRKYVCSECFYGELR